MEESVKMFSDSENIAVDILNKYDIVENVDNANELQNTSDMNENTEMQHCENNEIIEKQNIIQMNTNTITNNNITKINCNDILFTIKDVQKYIFLQLSTQNNIQKINVLLNVCMQFYRILLGSLLLSFVPQKCGDHICGITENLYLNQGYMIVYILNFMTFFSFFLLYLVEIKRENRLITYLDVNIYKPDDAVNVAIALRKLPDDKRENIIFIDKIYQQIGCCVIGVVIFNTVLSAIIIYESYLDNKTITAFITNVLFMSIKVADVYSIANTENNIFYSAYITNRLQFNDVDQHKIIKNDDFGTNLLVDDNVVINNYQNEEESQY